MPMKERLNKMAQVKPTQKKKISGPALAAIIVSIVLIVAMIVSLVASSGIFTRLKTGASTENFKINGSMLQYYTMSYYQNWYYNNYYYILLGYIQLDDSKPLSEQYTDTSKTTTFAQGVRSYVEQILKYCEAALADKDFDYDNAQKEAEEYADSSIASLKESARSNSMNLSTYIRANFGENVSKSDLEKAIILQSVASDYADFAYERIWDNMTDDRKGEYFLDNLSSFVKAEYMYFSLSQPESPKEIDADQYEGGKDSEEYKAAVEAENERVKVLNDGKKLQDEAFIKQLSEAKDVDEFKKILITYKFNDDFWTTYSTETKEWLDSEKFKDQESAEKEGTEYVIFRDSVRDAIIEAVLAGKSDITSDEEGTDAQADEDTDTTASEETKWEKLQKTLAKSVITQINKTVSNATKTTSYAVSTGLGKWLFGGVKDQFGGEYDEDETFDHVSAKENETWTNSTEITDETKLAYGAYTVNAYIVVKPAYRSEEPTYNVGHILFKVDSGATDEEKAEIEAEAKAVLEQIKAKAVNGVVSEEDFEKFGDEHTADSKVFYENVADGDMVDEFNDWIFGDDSEAHRTHGFVDIIKTEDYGWHIMYFNGVGETEWSADAHDGAASEDLEKWYDELKTTVTINTSLIKTFLDD